MCWARAAGDQDFISFEVGITVVALNLGFVSVQKVRAPFVDGNPVALQLGSNDLCLASDDVVDAERKIVHRNLPGAAVRIPIDRLHRQTGKLEDSLPHGFAWDRAGVNTNAADHACPINYGNALARLRRSDSSFLARRPAADDNHIVSQDAHFKTSIFPLIKSNPSAKAPTG